MKSRMRGNNETEKETWENIRWDSKIDWKSRRGKFRIQWN